ncbi:hypothetical protein H0G86_013314, partial [Trichoderma simmonsii]
MCLPLVYFLAPICWTNTLANHGFDWNGTLFGFWNETWTISHFKDTRRIQDPRVVSPHPRSNTGAIKKTSWPE